MTAPTPELMTAEQAAAWVSEGPSHGVHINNKTLNAIARTVIALHEALAAEKARADAAEARVAVRVKPLVWGLPLGGFYTAHLPFYGKIEIMRDEVRGVEAFILYRATPHRRHYPTLEAAKAAAQADYEARIRAALETGAGDE